MPFCSSLGWCDAIMLFDFLGFDKTGLLYLLISPSGFGVDILGLIALGIGIFVFTQVVFYIQMHCSKNQNHFLSNLLFSKIQSVVLISSLCIGGCAIGYFYSGIFEIFLMVVFSFLILLSMIDYKILAVPDWMNVGLFVCIFIGVIFFSENFWDALLGGFAISGLFSLLRVFGDIIFSREVLGEGDIIFGASIGMLLGVYDSLMSIFWGCLIASLCVIVARIFGKKVLKLPMITCISIGLLFCFIEGIIND